MGIIMASMKNSFESKNETKDLLKHEHKRSFDESFASLSTVPLSCGQVQVVKWFQCVECTKTLFDFHVYIYKQETSYYSRSFFYIPICSHP